MTRQEIAAKLREALALMNNDGAHWVKGEFIEQVDDLEYGYCSLGAIRHVTGTDVESPSEESDEVASALSEVLPEVRGLSLNGLPEDVYDRIVTWNDDLARTWDEVVAKFTEAADRMEKS